MQALEALEDKYIRRMVRGVTNPRILTLTCSRKQSARTESEDTSVGWFGVRLMLAPR